MNVMAFCLGGLLGLFSLLFYLIILHFCEHRIGYGLRIKELWYRVDCLPFWPFKGHIQLKGIFRLAGENTYDAIKIYKRHGNLCLVSEPNGWLHIATAKTAIESGVDPAGLCNSSDPTVITDSIICHRSRFGDTIWLNEVGDELKWSGASWFVTLRNWDTKRCSNLSEAISFISEKGGVNLAAAFKRRVISNRDIAPVHLGLGQAFNRAVLETNEVHHLEPVRTEDILNSNGEVVTQISNGEQISSAIPRGPATLVQEIGINLWSYQGSATVVGKRGDTWSVAGVKLSSGGGFSYEDTNFEAVIRRIQTFRSREEGAAFREALGSAANRNALAPAAREYFNQRRASVEPSVEPPNIIARRLSQTRWEARTAEHTACLEALTGIRIAGSSYSWQISGTKHDGGQLPLHEGFFVKERAIGAIQNIYGEQIAAALDRISDPSNPTPVVWSNVNPPPSIIQISQSSAMINGNRFVVMDIQGREVVLEKMERESNPNETRWRVTFTGDQTNTIIQDSWTSRERALDFVRGCKGYLIADALDEVSRSRTTSATINVTMNLANGTVRETTPTTVSNSIETDFTNMSVADTIRELGRRERANIAVNQDQIIVGSGGRRSMTVGEMIANGSLQPITFAPPASFNIPAEAAQRVADAQALSTEWHMRAAFSDAEKALADSFEPEDEDFAV